MPFRVSFFNVVQQAKLGGWSENFWNSASQIDTAAAQAATLAPLLDSCHGVPAYLSNYRVSDADNFRNVQVFNTNGKPGSIPSNPGYQADFVTTAALLLIKSNLGYITRQWMRCTLDSNVTKGGVWTPFGTWQTNFKAFVGGLLAGNWSLRKLNPAVPAKIIVGVSAAGVVNVLAHGFTEGQRVRISRVKSTITTNINGIWKIHVVDPDNFTLNGYLPPTGVAFGTRTATARLQSYIYDKITSCVVDRATKHATGRPFGLLTGRRKTRKS